MMDSIITSKLDSYGIKHAYTENGLRSTDYIIVPTFRERVMKCMEDNRNIVAEIVRNDYEPYSILFKAEMHSDIYNPNAKRSADADIIVNNLRSTALEAYTNTQIRADLAHIREHIRAIGDKIIDGRVYSYEIIDENIIGQKGLGKQSNFIIWIFMLERRMANPSVGSCISITL
jgi:hypothetical protein